MTGLGRSIKKPINKVTPKELRKADPINSYFDKAVDKTHFSPRIPKADEGPVIPLPDEEALSFARRRQRSRRRGARASTVLSGGDDDTQG